MKKIDKLVVFLLVNFFVISITGLYSADNININVDGIVYKQIVWYLVGFLVMYLFFLIDIKYIYKYVWIIYLISNFLLLILLFFGPVINNARCWFKIPGLGTLQVSEFVKITLIIVLSSFFVNSSKRSDIYVLFFSFLIVLLPSVLTFLEPDTGAVLMYLIIWGSMVLYRGIKKRWFVIGGSIICALLFTFIFIYIKDEELFVRIFGSSAFLRVERLTYWFNKEGLQLNKSLTSIGMSGITGSGFNNNLLYFPEAHTDFIFAVLASNFGFLGTLIILGSIIIFDTHLLSIAELKKHKKDKYLIVGVVAVLFYQQFQNISMTFGLLPITGITLPFISYGGSSLLSYFIMIGLILNVKKNQRLRRG